MKTLLLGAGGQLATDLAPLFPDAICLSRSDVDVTNTLALQSTLHEHRPELILNTTAYNLVDKAESQQEIALHANAFAPLEMARWCANYDATLVHISTDYVFGADQNRQSPYTETDEPGPLGMYGRTKLWGETAVRQNCKRHFVIRTCGLYGHAATKSKGNFVKTMLRLGKEKPELRVVNDQRCTPTCTRDLAAAIQALAFTNQYGLYHVTNTGSATWFELAVEALRLAGIGTPVRPITTAEFGAPAPRPAYSVLDCSKFEATTGRKLRPWQEALREYIEASN